jgi:hypothetical protein
MEEFDQQDDAMHGLLVVQELLGSLGFTLTSDGNYYKDYALLDGGIARLAPVFDRGISLDVSYNLVGFNLTNSKFISAASLLEADLPAECKSDMGVIINGISSTTSRQMVETFMVTTVCATCGEEVNSFLRLGGKDVCVRCMGYSDGQSRDNQ